MLSADDDKDTGEKRDDRRNKTKIESEDSDQANEDKINRQQEHSDVSVEGHGPR